MIDETFECHELPCVPGGLRACLTAGIAGYLGIHYTMLGDNHRSEAMRDYPEAFCRLVRAVAEESRRMMVEGIPPFSEAIDDRGKEDTDLVEIRIHVNGSRFRRTVCSKVSKERAEEICSMVRSRGHQRIDPGAPVPLDEGALCREKALQQGFVPDTEEQRRAKNG